jgi:hypothetical protein
MEAPPNLNATAEPKESSENKMSCRGKSPAASFTQRRNTAAPKAFGAVLGGKPPGSARFQRAGWKARPLLRIRYGGILPKRTFVNSAINA